MEAVQPNKNKVHVTFRVPQSVSASVEEYASTRNICRTEAYVRLVELGLKAAGEKDQGDIEAKLDEILELLRPQTPPSKEEAARAVATVCARFPQIIRAWLFGSFARGEQTHGSDIDIRIEVDSEMRFNLHDLDHFTKEVERLSGRTCDVVSARVIKNAALRDAIERDKELVYER